MAMGDLAVGEVSGYREVKGGTLGTQTFRKFPYKKIHRKFPKTPSLPVTWHPRWFYAGDDPRLLKAYSHRST